VVVNGWVRRRPTMCVLRVASPRLAADLTRLGVTPGKMRTLEPWGGPERLMPAYFRGLLDGNGTWCETSRGQWIVGLYGRPVVVDFFSRHVERWTGGRPTVQDRGTLRSARLQNMAAAQRLARILYDGAEAWMSRKRILAERLMARPIRGYVRPLAGGCPPSR
jgi:hypothetical protein